MVVGDGAWCWFNEPRALTTRDVTIIGWVARNGDIRVASYNNETRKLVTNTLHPRLQRDDPKQPIKRHVALKSVALAQPFGPALGLAPIQ